MRVATRRMRVGVDLFSSHLNNDDVYKLKKGLRKTGKSLGRVRDLDVIIGIVNNFILGLSHREIEIVTLLLDYCKNRRDSSRKKMIRYLTSNVYSDFKGFIDEAINSSEPYFELDDYNINATTFCNASVSSKVDQIHSLNWVIEKPTIKNLHKLRVCFKQLRYTIEFFFNILDGDAIKAISILKAIQDHLGRINDLAVLFNYVYEVGIISETDSISAPFQPLKDELSLLITGFPGVWQEFRENPINGVLSLTSNFG